jgi:hypothetical protein
LNEHQPLHSGVAIFNEESDTVTTATKETKEPPGWGKDPFRSQKKKAKKPEQNPPTKTEEQVHARPLPLRHRKREQQSGTTVLEHIKEVSAGTPTAKEQANLTLVEAEQIPPKETPPRRRIKSLLRQTSEEAPHSPPLPKKRRRRLTLDDARRAIAGKNQLENYT